MDRKISSPFSPCPSWGAHPRGKGHSRFAVRQRRSLDRCGERGKIVVPLVHGRSHLNVEWPRTSFAETWPDESILQQAAAKLPWFHSR
jgi:hypothetical protein